MTFLCLKPNPCLYTPLNLKPSGILRKPEVDLIVTEGEKKALKASQEGFPTVSFPGVWAWKKNDKPIPDFDDVIWDGRIVYVIFDSDAAANPGVSKAEYQLAREIESRGAHVQIVPLPQLGGEKTGLDDFLISDDGPESLRRRIKLSQPPIVPPNSYHLSDYGNAERLVDRHGRDFRYLQNHWLLWDGTRWSRDVSHEIDRRAAETIKTMVSASFPDAVEGEHSSLQKWRSQSLSAAKLTAMVSCARSMEKVVADDSQFDQDPLLLNVRNGVIDLRSGELSGHRRDLMLTMLSPVQYEPNARCPHFLKFIMQVLQGKSDLVDFLQRAVGYSLTGDTSEQCLFFLNGTGANGKSTLLKTLSKMLGDYSKSAQVETLMRIARGFVKIWPASMERDLSP